MKEINNQKLWNLELGSHKNMNVHIWIIIGFQQRDRQDSQILNEDNFFRLSVVNAQCITGTENYPDAGILLIYDDEYYSQGYAHIKQVFRALTKNDILQPCISDDHFRSSNAGVVELCYTFSI